MKKLLFTTAIASAFVYLTNMKRKENEKNGDFKIEETESGGIKVQWISADDYEDEDDFLAEMMGLKDKEKTNPMFYIGDTVMVWSPYEGSFVVGPEDIAPKTYTVTESWHDPFENVFRYKLDEGFEGWVSEDWLSLPNATTFSKIIPKVTIKAVTEPMPDDNSLEINYWLDTLRHGNEEEIEQAKERLRELVEGEGEK